MRHPIPGTDVEPEPERGPNGERVWKWPPGWPGTPAPAPAPAREPFSPGDGPFMHGRVRDGEQRLGRGVVGE